MYRKPASPARNSKCLLRWITTSCNCLQSTSDPFILGIYRAGEDSTALAGMTDKLACLAWADLPDGDRNSILTTITALSGILPLVKQYLSGVGRSTPYNLDNFKMRLLSLLFWPPRLLRLRKNMERVSGGYDWLFERFRTFWHVLLQILVPRKGCIVECNYDAIYSPHGTILLLNIRSVENDKQSIKYWLLCNTNKTSCWPFS